MGVAGGGTAEVGEAGVEVEAAATGDEEVAAAVGDALLEPLSLSRDRMWLWV